MQDLPGSNQVFGRGPSESYIGQSISLLLLDSRDVYFLTRGHLKTFLKPASLSQLASL